MSAPAPPPQPQPQPTADLVTQAQEQARGAGVTRPARARPLLLSRAAALTQLALLSSFFYNYTGGVAVTAPPERGGSNAAPQPS